MGKADKRIARASVYPPYAGARGAWWREESFGMAVRYVLSDYVDAALAHAVYDKLEDGSFVGTIPECVGVICFAPTLRECQEELQSTLEDWILLGFKLGHPLPLIDQIDLNVEPADGALEPN